MAKVVMQAVVSVDGFVARPDDEVGPLFDWYGNGDTELTAHASGWTFHVSRSSADYAQPFWDAIRIQVIGRHLFDLTNGWDGKAAAAEDLVVVTPRPLSAGEVGGQAFAAGLVDEVAMDVAPVVLGAGVRFFGSHSGAVLLDDPDRVVRGNRVLHLHYTVRH